MKPLKIKDWFIFGEWYGINWFHACYFEGVTYTIKNYLGYGPSQAVIEQEGDIQRMFLSRLEWTNIGKRYLDEIIVEPKKLEKVLHELLNASDELILFSKKFRGIDIDGLTFARQIGWLKEYHQKHFQVWTLGQITNILELENSFLSDYLKLWLATRGLKDKKMLSVFQILAMPRRLTAAQKEEREMLALAQRKNPIKELKKHWQKYRWLHFGWTGPSLNFDYFVEIQKKLHKLNTAKKDLNLILSNDKELVKNKIKLIKDLKIPKNIQFLFQLLEEILYIKAYRMDALLDSYDAIQPLLKKIAQQYHLSLRQIYSLDIRWLIKMINSKNIDIQRINDLAKYSIQYFDGIKINLLFGNEARKITNQIKKYLPPVEKIVELKGDIAYPGKVQGKVKVINFAREMNKFSEGDILVSYVTDPSLLPVMKKAKAFVTNTGGLTSHAAIVARELKIPCVIGTKIATQIFKDGDLVEVDATKGIVRKL